MHEQEQARKEQAAFLAAFAGDESLGELGSFLGLTARTNTMARTNKSDLSEGSSGNDVKRLQEDLNTLGYSAPVTGSFGSETTSAVKDFQRLADLPQTGTVDKATKNAMDIDLRAGGAKTDWLTGFTSAATTVTSAVGAAGEPSTGKGKKRAPKKEGMPSWVIPVAVIGGIVVIGGGMLFAVTR
jgi:peptidoglycan hydrolase-like protein with peptidoglycan-binding domain